MGILYEIEGAGGHLYVTREKPGDYISGGESDGCRNAKVLGWGSYESREA